MSAARSGSGFGGNPISYLDIAAFRSLLGVRMTAEDVRAIRMMDAAYLGAVSEKTAKKKR